MFAAVDSRVLLTVALATVSAPLQAAAQRAQERIPYDSLAARMVAALKPARGERAILRVHRATMPGLVSPLQTRLRGLGVVVDVMDYGAVPDFEQRLARASIYIWLPTPTPAVGPSAKQRAALAGWLQSKRGRQIHFHWSSITTTADGFNVPFPRALDRMHVNAVLRVDYARMRRELNDLAARLRAGEVRVTTPEGTDLRFALGNRPITKQDGDASRTALSASRVAIDREIELPAGVLRVAPLEASVRGVLVIPRLRLDAQATAHNVRIRILDGRTEIAADSNEAAARAFFAKTPTLASLRELGIGVNPRLVVPARDSLIPYAGYGAGVVRLGLGDNTELGGRITGGAVRWMFFRRATVMVGLDTLVAAGRLAAQRAARN